MDPSPRQAAAFNAERQRQLRRRFRLRGPIGRLLAELELAEPAPVAEIVAAQSALGAAFPRDYVEFLRASNGGAGQVGRALVELWPVHELRERNQRLGSEPGLVAFGSGSPGVVFAFRAGEFLRLPHRDRRGTSFADFLQSLAGP